MLLAIIMAAFATLRLREFKTPVSGKDPEQTVKLGGIYPISGNNALAQKKNKSMNGKPVATGEE